MTSSLDHQPPPRPSPDIAIEAWDPTLDPLAISREAAAPSPWSVGPLAGLLALALGTTAVLVPWRPFRREHALPPSSFSRTIAFTLRESRPVSSPPEAFQAVPGGGTGRPQWAPAPSPGPGGFGDLDALTAIKAYAPSGELSGSAMPLAPVTALGGGLARPGAGGGSPSGAASGTGGGGRGSRLGTSGSVGALDQVPSLVPVHQEIPFYQLPPGSKVQRELVRVRVRILLDGTVREASMVEGPEFLRANAEAAARKWRFKPLLASGFSEPLDLVLIFHYLLRTGR